ncbi:MAG: Membrane protein-like protein [Chthoniobacteraceae bacterium]|nr:Membrane protein-like protein [Chthoniobacteraceae bacterium]
MRLIRTARCVTLFSAASFALITFTASWWRWWTFQYETFDLAFYVQALWLALHGQWHVSLLNVPLLGNHFEPIVFLATPLFAVWPHPMVLVALQSIALATLPLTGWRIAQRLGFSAVASALLAIATVIAPATGFVALHEFHPEAFAAPLLLLLIEARLAKNRGRFWLWFLMVLACKENLALLLISFCAVHAFIEWRSKATAAFQLYWNALPALAAATCFFAYGKYLGPALNAGNVDYLELYSHLGKSGPEILGGFFTQPGRAIGALGNALAGGNLLWALLLPMLGLPLFRARWLLIALPLLLQHLLSWRASEWSVRFHYAAPMIPLFWIAAVEVLKNSRFKNSGALLVVVASAISQLCIGPAEDLINEVQTAQTKRWERDWKTKILARIPPQASVTASMPYLSHLATRQELHSLHHVLKGLKTLSRAEYHAGPPTDVALVDYADPTTFDSRSGYYHPVMRTADGRIVSSSDTLLHDFLARTTWKEYSTNSLTLYQQGSAAEPSILDARDIHLSADTDLTGFKMDPMPEGYAFRFEWALKERPANLLWCMLVVSNGHTLFSIIKGPCAPASNSGIAYESWTVSLPPGFAAKDYRCSLLFYDNINASWNSAPPPFYKTFIVNTIGL